MDENVKQTASAEASANQLTEMHRCLDEEKNLRQPDAVGMTLKRFLISMAVGVVLGFGAFVLLSKLHCGDGRLKWCLLWGAVIGLILTLHQYIGIKKMREWTHSKATQDELCKLRAAWKGELTEACEELRKKHNVKWEAGKKQSRRPAEAPAPDAQPAPVQPETVEVYVSEAMPETAPAPAAPSAQKKPAPAPAASSAQKKPAPAPAASSAQKKPAPAPAASSAQKKPAPAPAALSAQKKPAPAPAASSAQKKPAPAPAASSAQKKPAPAPAAQSAQKKPAPASAAQSAQKKPAPAPAASSAQKKPASSLDAQIRSVSASLSQSRGPSSLQPQQTPPKADEEARRQRLIAAFRAQMAEMNQQREDQNGAGGKKK